MANPPRKFSEKIALHNQKQAEETAAFEEIMREVCVATKGAYQKHHLHINHQALGTFRGGSLPNVNQIGNNSIDLQNALNSLEEIKKAGRESLIDRNYRESRSRNVAIRSRQIDKRVDCSPYSLPYLSPPPDTSWRRTNSDSALHQSAMNPENYHNSVTPPECRRVPDEGLIMLDGNSKPYWDSKKQSLTPPMHSRPKSCEVPGINIYHSEQEPGIVHIPISNNTGSLPDLSNLQFPSPLVTPLDVEESTPPYNTNSLRVPSLHTRYLHTCKGLAVEAQAQGLPLDPYQQNTQYTLYQHPQPPPQQHQHSQHQQQQQSLPTQTSPSLGISTTSSSLPSSHMSGYRSGSPAETSCSAPQSPVSQSLSPSSSPGVGGSPKTHNLSDQAYYLASQAVSANTVQQSFEQFNLIDNVPVSTSINRVYLPPQSCLHYSQVQNVGLVDGQDLLESHYYGAQSGAQMASYSQSVQSPLSGQPQQTTPQTPQTPSSIPDIILTDFSTHDDGLSRHDFVKDLGTAMVAGMSGSFDSDLFPPDDAEVLKADLVPIDFDGLQMLTDPDIVTDAATEDSFRLDRL